MLGHIEWLHRLSVTAAVAGGLVIGAVAQGAEIPAGYPASYAEIIAAAEKEGLLRIYSSLDESSAQPVLDEFRALYPGITLEYSNLNSTTLVNRVISEAAAQQESADFVWTSTADTGLQLAADGLVAEYDSPEIPGLPAAAVWKKMVFGVTADPLVFLYNKRQLEGDLVPQSHADLLRLVQEKPDVFRGKVLLLDPTRTSGLQANVYDALHMPDFWTLIKTLAANGMALQTSNGTMIEKVASGEAALAWNVEGSYAAVQLAKNPGVGVVMPSDYTLSRSRVVFLMKSAQHPNAARLFLDLLVSKRGQQLLADESKIYAIREDLSTEFSGAALRGKLGDALKPIPISEDLLERVMNDENRLAFVKQFQDAMRGN